MKLANLLEIHCDRVLKIIKFLYDVPETGNHWFVIYHDYHVNKLKMKQFTYDAYLLHRFNSFNVVDMQTDNTFILADDAFAKEKEKTINKIKIMTKP